MTIDEAINDLTSRINSVCPEVVIRTQKRSAEEASIRAYAPAGYESAIKEAIEEPTLRLLTGEGLDVQVLVYDIATSPPPEQ